MLAAGVVAIAVAVPSDGAVPPGGGSPPGTYRGVIEGFYGPPWSHGDRLSLLPWLGRHGLNTYVYAPKDDPYQRQRWRDPYPPAEEARFAALVGTARRAGVRFVYSISPGLDMCYSSASEQQALLQKLAQLRRLGVRTLMLGFDDIPRSFHCAEDEAAYGAGDVALGRAHADVSNAVHRWNTGGRLIVVPSDYAELGRTPYLGALAPMLARAVDLVWTGPHVVSSRITAAHAQTIAAVYRRPPLLWDNYPVNDFARDDLHLGPLAGRAGSLPRRLAGFLSNPMNEPWASRIPLYTVAVYLRNPSRYRPEAAWRAAVRELGGRRGATALQRLADNSQSSSTLDDPRSVWGRESTVLWSRALLAARALRGPTWRDRLTAADRRLRLEWRTLIQLPKVVRPSVAAELDPWTRALAANDDLGRAGLRYVAATRPRFQSVRVRRRAGRWEVTGRLIVPTRQELDRLAVDLDVTAGVIRRLPKETHGGSTLFLHGHGMARKACTPTPVRTTLDGRPIPVGSGGRFRVRSKVRPKRLMARDRRGLGTLHELVGRTRSIPAATPAERRVRRQVTARLTAIARAVRREDLNALRRYDERPGGFEAWRGLLAVSRFDHVRFPLGAFEAGALRCGGPVVAQVSWQLSGQVPPGVTIGTNGKGTLGRPTVLLLKNRGSAPAPDWRIVHALRFLPYPNAISE
jgi:hypothetical protein